MCLVLAVRPRDADDHVRRFASCAQPPLKNERAFETGIREPPQNPVDATLACGRQSGWRRELDLTKIAAPQLLASL
jgi:hypothetical protein